MFKSQSHSYLPIACYSYSLKTRSSWVRNVAFYHSCTRSLSNNSCSFLTPFLGNSIPHNYISVISFYFDRKSYSRKLTKTNFVVLLWFFLKKKQSATVLILLVVCFTNTFIETAHRIDKFDQVYKRLRLQERIVRSRFHQSCIPFIKTIF